MHFVHLECINPIGNAYRFFRFEIQIGLFQDHQLTAILGRVGSQGNLRHISSGSLDEVWDRLLVEAKNRFMHGYRVANLDVPKEISVRLAKMKEAVDHLDRCDQKQARAQTLASVRQLLESTVGTPAALRQIDETIDEIEPGRRRALRHTGRQRSPLNVEKLVSSPAVASAKRRQRSQMLREAVRTIAYELLYDDPLALSVIDRGLSLPPPDELDDTNVSFIRSHKDMVLAMRISQFLFEAQLTEDSGLDPGLKDRLAMLGIGTVGDLVRTPLVRLEEGGLDADEIGALAYNCLKYKLYLNMTGLKLVNDAAWS